MYDDGNVLYNPQFGRRGYIQTFYGFGKGKTTASIGSAFRALGHGWKVLLIMFTKGKHHDDIRFYGEVNSIKERTELGEFRVEQFGPDRVLYYNELTDRMCKIVNDGWNFVKDEINGGYYDLIILDELHIVLDMKILDIDDVVKTLKNKPSHVEIVTTGRAEIPEIIDVADLVTELKPIKHYYRKNVKARRGIEY